MSRQNAGEVSAMHCCASGSGLEAAAAGEQAEFLIEARDAFGNAAEASASDFKVTGSSEAEAVQVAVSTGPSKGEFCATYTPSAPGMMQIMIQYKGYAISGCPYAVPVSGAGCLCACLGAELGLDACLRVWRQGKAV